MLFALPASFRNNPPARREKIIRDAARRTQRHGAVRIQIVPYLALRLFDMVWPNDGCLRVLVDQLKHGHILRV